MNWFFIGLASLAVLGAMWFALSRLALKGEVVDLRGRSEVPIVLTERGFEPAHIQISLGTKVTFTTTRPKQFWPASNAHPTHELYPEFDPKEPIESRQSWSFVFTKPGTWGYH